MEKVLTWKSSICHCQKCQIESVGCLFWWSGEESQNNSDCFTKTMIFKTTFNHFSTDTISRWHIITTQYHSLIYSINNWLRIFEILIIANTTQWSSCASLTFNTLQSAKPFVCPSACNIFISWKETMHGLDLHLPQRSHVFTISLMGFGCFVWGLLLARNITGINWSWCCVGKVSFSSFF